jgi:hypothetical protein
VGYRAFGGTIGTKPSLRIWERSPLLPRDSGSGRLAAIRMKAKANWIACGSDDRS